MLLGAVAALLYVCMLIEMMQARESGDAVVGQAFQALFTVTGLWIVLACLVIAAAIYGSMPRWGWVAIVLIPLAAVATFVALDAVSSDHNAMAIFAIVLPLLVAASVVEARMPWSRTPRPPHAASVIWASVTVLSIGALIAAS